jgi:hypothetical protein
MTDYLYAMDNAITAAGHSARATVAVRTTMPRLEEARSLLSSSLRHLLLSLDDTRRAAAPRHTLPGRHGTLVHKVLDEIPSQRQREGDG